MIRKLISCSLRGALLGAFALAAPAAALDPARPMQEYGFQIWGSRDGLSQNTVNAMGQSRDGYLWIATRTGLVRFDGARFVLYNASEAVEELVSDPSGRVWAGFTGGELLSLEVSGGQQPVSWSRRPGDRVHALFAEPGGVLWAGTSRGLARQIGRRLEPVVLPELPGSVVVTALVRETGGPLWIGTAGRGLLRSTPTGGRLFTVRDGLPDDRIGALAAGPGGELWVGTPRGLARLREGRWTRFTTADGLPSDVIHALLRDRDGNLWVGTRRGLARFRGAGFESLPQHAGTPSSGVLSLFEDSEGGLWMGTDAHGIARLRDLAFSSFTLGGELARVWSAHRDRAGALWLGSNDLGALRLQGDRVDRFGPAQGLPHERVRAILQDRHGAFWFGTAGGLGRWRDGSLQVWRRAEGLPDEYVRVVYEDRDGSLWVGTDGGLARWDGTRLQPVGLAAGLPVERVTLVARDRRGTLWIGLSSGLYRAAGGGRFERFPDSPPTPILALHEDRSGTLWFGTLRGGLLRLRAGRLTAFRQKDGLFEDTAYQVFEDRLERLWMSSNKGIHRVRKADLEAFSEGRLEFIPSAWFDDTDGMKSAECNGGNQPSALAWPDGRIWFPTFQGFAVLHPERTPANLRPPPVVVEEVVADGVSSVPRPGETLRLRPGVERVEFRYTATSLIVPEKVRFRLRLNGFDREWEEGSPQRTIVYTSLPAGSYTLQVLAGNNDGVWNLTGAEARIEVRPFLWETTWFRAGAALSLFLGGGAVMRLRLRSVKRRERELAHLVAERTRDLEREKARAEEASRAKGEFLANMSHEIRTPMNGMLGMAELLLHSGLTEPQRRLAETLRSSGQALMRVLNQVLDLSKI
ncbi:MAG TPA: hypothetical protein DD490_19930, partial [Acidobacteria bacterium]|nr:hypothetical protein [Acidobacteriota bacterium]